VPAWRFVFFSLVRKALPDTNVLFVGMPPAAREIAEYLSNRPDMGFKVIGYLDVEEDYKGAPYLGHPDQIGEILRQNRIDLIAVDQYRDDPGWLQGNQLLDLRSSGVKIEQTAHLYETVFGRVSLRDLRPAQILTEEPALHGWSGHLQTLYSFALALVGLILFLPIMGVVFLLVKATSPGPAFYKQRRMGRNGATFFLYKFRSMYTDAEARTGPVWATTNDPRVTPVGGWLRKLRLDELPQFFNVLRGEMSVVGPRPERPEFCKVLEEQIPFYHQRHSVKPGITGWAQINHHYTETIEDTITKVEYDLYYVKHLAPALDAYIIFHTVKVMLLSRGAQ
jgi:exopolysaccharide biosynthesis polyprenyl glycosylphosphotransferase